MEVGAGKDCILPTGLLPGREICMGRVHDAGRWPEAEDSIAELIARIQPSEDSWKHRKAIADYIQSVICKSFSCQVFIFGSVPFKTSLPDGDIDLTLFSTNDNLKDTWIDKVYQVIKAEEKNENAEFHLTEVHLIEAGVKVIKCLVESIVVDISFNQMGGLGTLCFLEEMDHLINQDHLFKRSVILIKAWCYYESRILGAHHGLISTYALETLILYIFHVFENSFTGPLQVLYLFLEFFSNFDWDNFCVSIWGPVPIHLLPEMAVIPPRKDNDELFHKKFFLRSCSALYDISVDGQHNKNRSFVSKCFNVVDPLCMHNNLGRSVCKGNFLRIRSACAFGAKKLARLLDLPKEKMISELTHFFKNTWERQGASFHSNSSTPSSEQLQPSKHIQVGASNTSGDLSNLNEQKDDISENPSGKHLADFGMSFYGAASQILKIINRRSKDTCSYIGSQMVVCHSKNQQDFSSKVISKNHVERTLESAEPVSDNKNHENLSSNCSNNIKKGDLRLGHYLCVFCSENKCFLSGMINASEISLVESHILPGKSENDDSPAIGSEHDCCRSKSPSFRIMTDKTVKSLDCSCSIKSSSLQAMVSSGASHSFHDSASLSVIASSMQAESGNCRTPQIAGNCGVQINKSSQKSDSGLVFSSYSQQRAVANSGIVPSALHPTGPPVPFLEMLQTYNVRSQARCYGGLYDELDDEALISDSASFSANLPGGLLSHNIRFLEPFAYPYPTVLPMAVKYIRRISPPDGLPRSIIFQESRFVPAANVWPETQIRTPDILTFGYGVNSHYCGIRTYPRILY